MVYKCLQHPLCENQKVKILTTRIIRRPAFKPIINSAASSKFSKRTVQHIIYFRLLCFQDGRIRSVQAQKLINYFKCIHFKLVFYLKYYWLSNCKCSLLSFVIVHGCYLNCCSEVSKRWSPKIFFILKCVFVFITRFWVFCGLSRPADRFFVLNLHSCERSFFLQSRRFFVLKSVTYSS